ncbi:MAG: NAD(P)-binding domain-containing protein [Terriglobia bacterium]
MAILGLGNMGAGMAGRLLLGGFSLIIFNRGRQRAQKFANEGGQHCLHGQASGREGRHSSLHGH